MNITSLVLLYLYIYIKYHTNTAREMRDIYAACSEVSADEEFDFAVLELLQVLSALAWLSVGVECHTRVSALDYFAPCELLEEGFEVVAVEFCAAEDDALLRLESVQYLLKNVWLT